MQQNPVHSHSQHVKYIVKICVHPSGGAPLVYSRCERQHEMKTKKMLYSFQTVHPWTLRRNILGSSLKSLRCFKQARLIWHLAKWTNLRTPLTTLPTSSTRWLGEINRLGVYSSVVKELWVPQRRCYKGASTKTRCSSSWMLALINTNEWFCIYENKRVVFAFFVSITLDFLSLMKDTT